MTRMRMTTAVQIARRRAWMRVSQLLLPWSHRWRERNENWMTALPTSRQRRRSNNSGPTKEPKLTMILQQPAVPATVPIKSHTSPRESSTLAKSSVDFPSATKTTSKLPDPPPRERECILTPPIRSSSTIIIIKRTNGEGVFRSAPACRITYCHFPVMSWGRTAVMGWNPFTIPIMRIPMMTMMMIILAAMAVVENRPPPQRSIRIEEALPIRMPTLPNRHCLQCMMVMGRGASW
mmetsp:Transcript_37996/g.68421  ORF Transcript_37996/g.68421 Transcript_37996/m.68421 type:complete len:235 (+) Transcript_37996:336-1040(+)